MKERQAPGVFILHKQREWGSGGDPTQAQSAHQQPSRQKSDTYIALHPLCSRLDRMGNLVVQADNVEIPFSILDTDLYKASPRRQTKVPVGDTSAYRDS